MDIKEVDIENFIWERVKDSSMLSSRGLDINPGMYYRQLELPGAGIPDILHIGIDRNGLYYKNRIHIVIYELKRGIIKCDHIGQVMRYKMAVVSNGHRFLKQLGINGNYDLHVDCVLIGSQTERDALAIFATMPGMLTIYEYKVDLEHGLMFYEQQHLQKTTHIGVDITNIKIKRSFRSHLRKGYKHVCEGQKSDDLSGFNEQNESLHEV